MHFFFSRPITIIVMLLNKLQMNRFCAISGECINISKSVNKFSPSTSFGHQTEFKGILGFSQVINFVTHLGVPIDITQKKASHFAPFIDSVAKKVNSWNFFALSQSTKVILRISILVAMTSYIMTCLAIPFGITSKIDYIINSFLWSRKGEEAFLGLRKRS